MRTWMIEPRDPLIARDGRPSDLGRFESLPFPLPSTLAGAARTRMASGQGGFSLSPEEAQELLSLAVHGPLLTELEGDQGASFYAPAPRDAVLFPAEGPGAPTGKPLCRRLVPRQVPQGANTDGLAEKGLLPVQFAGERLGTGQAAKPLAGAPAFWAWEVFERWLAKPVDSLEMDLSDQTLAGLPRERRTHLAIEPGERVGLEGMLFETEGLRFLAGEERSLAPRRLALTLRAEEDTGRPLLGQALALRDELAPLGGERRLARWSESPTPWPTLPAGIRSSISKSRRARLVLLTPAFFTAGALPAWRGGEVPGAPGVKATVKAACVPRAVVVSGWDLASKRPKPTRRLAPAGSVYFLELNGTEADLAAWCEALWLQPVSDDEQARRDGFGLAALGVW